MRRRESRSICPPASAILQRSSAYGRSTTTPIRLHAHASAATSAWRAGDRRRERPSADEHELLQLLYHA